MRGYGESLTSEVEAYYLNLRGWAAPDKNWEFENAKLNNQLHVLEKFLSP